MALSFSFRADGSQYSRGLDKMRAQTKAFSASIGGMLKGLFAGAALIGIKRFADELDRIGKISKQLNISTESLQRLAFVSDLAGTGVETLAKALSKSMVFHFTGRPSLLAA